MLYLKAIALYFNIPFGLNVYQKVFNECDNFDLENLWMTFHEPPSIISVIVGPPLTEDDLVHKAQITPNDVLRLQRPTKSNALACSLCLVLVCIPEAIEMTDSHVTFDMKILKNSRCFRPRRAVGFDRSSGAIESNCPSGSKTSRIFQNFHEHRDGTVHTLDGAEYRFLSIFLGYLCKPDANVFDIEFTRFKIRDLDSGAVLFEISKPDGGNA